MDGTNKQPVFNFVAGYFKDDKFSSNYVLQFNKPKFGIDQGIKKDIGSKKADTFNIVVAGIYKVAWGNKVPRGCVSRSQLAFAIDEEGGPKLEDDFVGMCAAWRYFFSA